MPVRDPLIRLIDSRISRSQTDMIATSASPTYRWYDAGLSEYLWVMDVDISVDGTRPDATQIVKAVPIADASHGVHKSGPGTRLRIQRSNLRRMYEIVGVAAIVSGQVTVIEVAYSSDRYTVGSGITYGSAWRPLTYAELGTPALNGGYAYGSLPYGTIGKFDAAGLIIYVYAP